MHTKNRFISFLALSIIGFIAFILYWQSTPFYTVVIQAGHEGRVTGNTGAETNEFKETTWNILVANEIAKTLRKWHIQVKRVPAELNVTRATIAVSIHFDGAKTPCNSGASIGYPNNDSFNFAQKWRNLYSQYFPFHWHEDNFTPNMAEYYAYRYIKAKKFLLLELGEITCKQQTQWLEPRLMDIAHLIAYSIARELDIPKERLKL